MSILGKTEIAHLFDRESESPEHDYQFRTTLKLMKEARISGKKVKYTLGYSNLTFDLWMILHKIDCYNSFDFRKQYLKIINKAFQERFTTMDEYKEQANFCRILKKLSLNNVWDAI